MGKCQGSQESFRQRIAGFMARGESETEPRVDSLCIPQLMNLPPADPITLLTGIRKKIIVKLLIHQDRTIIVWYKDISRFGRVFGK